MNFYNIEGKAEIQDKTGWPGIVPFEISVITKGEKDAYKLAEQRIREDLQKEYYKVGDVVFAEPGEFFTCEADDDVERVDDILYCEEEWEEPAGEPCEPDSYYM